MGGVGAGGQGARSTGGDTGSPLVLPALPQMQVAEEGCMRGRAGWWGPGGGGDPRGKQGGARPCSLGHVEPAGG